jgi:hypothetical protein
MGFYPPLFRGLVCLGLGVFWILLGRYTGTYGDPFASLPRRSFDCSHADDAVFQLWLGQ